MKELCRKGSSELRVSRDKYKEERKSGARKRRRSALYTVPVGRKLKRIYWIGQLFLVTIFSDSLRPVSTEQAEWKPDTASDMEKYL